MLQLKRVSLFLQRHTYIQRTLWVLLVCALYAIVVIPIYKFYYQEGLRRQVHIDRAPLFADMGELKQRADQLNITINELVYSNDTLIPKAENFIDILLRATGADFANNVLKVRASFLPVGTFALDNTTITQGDIRGAVTKDLEDDIIDPEGITTPSALATPVIVTIGTTTIKFPANQIMEARDLQIQFQNGNQANYPLDTYPAYIFIEVHQEQGTDPIKTYPPVPFQAHFDGAVQSLLFRAFIIHDSVTKMSFYIRTRRTITTVLFSAFISMLMWFLTLALGSLWMQLVVRGHEIAPAHMSIGVALLFALPSLRNAQPAIPPVGVASDMFGYIWNITLITIFSVSIIITYTLRWSFPKKKPDSIQIVVSEPATSAQFTPVVLPSDNKHPHTLPAM